MRPGTGSPAPGTSSNSPSSWPRRICCSIQDSHEVPGGLRSVMTLVSPFRIADSFLLARGEAGKIRQRVEHHRDAVLSEPEPTRPVEDLAGEGGRGDGPADGVGEVERQAQVPLP